MRLFFTVLSCLMFCTAGVARPSGQRQSPFACDRLALDPAAPARPFPALGPTPRTLKTGVKELPSGYAFQFPTDMKTVQLVAEWAAGERLCCPFFDIRIHFVAEGGPMWLTISGREGTKQFVEVDAAAWIKP